MSDVIDNLRVLTGRIKSDGVPDQTTKLRAGNVVLDINQFDDTYYINVYVDNDERLVLMSFETDSDDKQIAKVITMTKLSGLVSKLIKHRDNA